MIKRYQLSLTEENVKQFRELSGKIGMPDRFLSTSVDAYIGEMVKMMDKALAKGKFTVSDMFFQMGESIKNGE
jgi:N-methylhydantoinase A/oxoprolinase/acetone carboxylase beta subunit